MLTGNEKHLKISDLVETDQTVVAEQFADYFNNGPQWCRQKHLEA